MISTLCSRLLIVAFAVSLWQVRGSSMIVLQVEVADFTLSDVKRQPPIAADGDAPSAGAVAFELMHPPARRPDDAAHVGRRDQHREDVAQTPHKIAAEFPAVVVLYEAQQAPVPNAPNDHTGVYAETVQPSSPGANSARAGVTG